MRATAFKLLLVLTALAQLVAGPLRGAAGCPASSAAGCCCVGATADSEVAHPDHAERGCCGELPDAPSGCDCHVDPAPAAPSEAPFELPEASSAVLAIGPSRFVAPVVCPIASPRPVPEVRLSGPPGSARHVALCVFLI